MSIIFCGTVCYAIQGGSNFFCCVTIQMKDIEQEPSCGSVYLMLYKGIQTFAPVVEILTCDHSNESH